MYVYLKIDCNKKSDYIFIQKFTRDLTINVDLNNLK